MRIQPATITIDRALWRDLSRPMGLARALPDALDNSLQMYTSRRLLVKLTCTSQHHDHSSNTAVGTYSFGRIELFECPGCTFAYVTWVLLHELFHAWAHQYHEDFFETVEHCRKADAFANRAFALLGGKRSTSCSSFELPLRVARGRLAAYRRYVTKVVNRGVK